MKYKLRNKEQGYEIPLQEKPEISGYSWLNAMFTGATIVNEIVRDEWEVIEEFEFPTKLFAVIQCDSVYPTEKPGLFTATRRWDYWASPEGELYSKAYVLSNFRNFRVLFEGVDED